MKKLSLAFTIVFNFILFSGGVFAASDTYDLTVNVVVGSYSKLTLASDAISFHSSDPDKSTYISANKGTVNITAQVRIGSSNTATLSIVADNDMIENRDKTAIINVSWTPARDPGFAFGNTATRPVIIDNWTGPDTRTKTFTYSSMNSRYYGYIATSTYTLTAP